MSKLLVGNFEASKDEKGFWVYKAIDSEVFKSNTKILKKKLHDKPRYKIVLEIEKNFKDEIDNFLGNLTKDLVKKIKTIIK